MLKHLLPALRATLVVATLTGIIFPLLITAVAQLCFPVQANGSLIRGKDNVVIGSRLLGQQFIRPGYFHPRPSAAGSGYCGEASSGTNLGPTSSKLILGDKTFAGVKALAETYRQENGLAPEEKVPVDAVTRSASGLDPDISVANAIIQARRVARQRSLPVEAVENLVRSHTEGRLLGFIGEPHVPVLPLNIALDGIKTP